LNAMWDSMERDLEALLNWFERESNLWSVRCLVGEGLLMTD
jgi:hypothetical protein